MDQLVREIKEGSTYRLAFTVRDYTETVIPAASLTTMRLTLTSLYTGAIVNNRNAQDVLNANNVTIDSSGNLVWEALPNDNQIQDDSLVEEEHRALFVWTYQSGSRTGQYDARLIVQNTIIGAASPGTPPETLYSQEGLAVPVGLTFTITHNLNNVNATLKTFIPYWGPTAVRIVTKTANTIVVAFDVASPSSFADIEVSST